MEWLRNKRVNKCYFSNAFSCPASQVLTAMHITSLHRLQLCHNMTVGGKMYVKFRIPSSDTYVLHILNPTRLSILRLFPINRAEETQLLLCCSYFHSPILVENALAYHYIHKTCNETDATCHGQKLDFWLCHVAHCITVTDRSATVFLW